MVAAAVCAALAARGERVAAFKPAVSGLDEDTGRWPADHELLAAVAGIGQEAEDVAPYRFGPAVSPHYGAELAGMAIDPRWLARSALEAGSAAGTLIVEGVGGLLVPLAADYLVRDLAVELRLKLLVVARPTLGTINHTLLTVEAARAAGLTVAGVVMTPWPASVRPIERSNRATVERLAGVRVSGLVPVDPESLAAAGNLLPIEEWLE